MTVAALRPRWIRLLAVALTAVLALALLTATPAKAHPGEHGDAHVLIFTETAAFRHTEAITQGVPVLEAAFADAGITSEHTEDSSIFNDADLAHFDALVMFQTSGDPWTAAEKAALERYQQAGGGIVAIHNAADMRGGYEWWDELIGSLMPGHAATGTSPGQPGTVRIEDQTHASTQHLPKRWERADEWYNFSANVRGDAHVLATMDETTYDPGSNAMGYDHPISWCKPYDGGRAWVTAMGHFGAHYTDEPDFVQHIVGGVEWATGLVESDCGATKWDQFERVALDQNTSAPFALDVAPDGRVFYTELVRGEIRVFDPTTLTTSTAITIPVYSGGEDGLMGIALDPNFEQNGHLFVYYAPASQDDTDPANFISRLSRFTVGENSQIDPASEVVVMEVPASRLPDEPGHAGGGLEFGPDGNLLLSVGDDVNPHSEPSGGYAPLSEREGTFHDARATSANTNDLRGKLLRIHPEPDGTYTIPEGNMFAPGTPDTRPEIYAMGFRNPFRFTIDPETGWVGLADYGPDNGSPSPDRGPAGIVEWNLIKEPGFYGWPLCIGPNEPYRDVDYTTDPVTVGDYFDCNNPINDSTKNTGLTELPPVQEPELYYGYQVSSVPEVIPPGGGLAPMGGPFYDYDPALESETKFPEYYDGKPFFYEWAKNEMYSLDLTDTGELEKVNPFLPDVNWMAPIDSEFGPDGSMYVMDWGGGFGRDNPDSGLYRVDYVSGSRSPKAVIAATPDSGQAPLTVQFDGSGSTDPENAALTYEWDFDGDGTVDATTPTAEHTYTENGVYDARLTVVDPHGKDGTTTVPITVGNTRPEVDFNLPPTGAFFNFGDEISWDVSVTDAEDATISDDDIIVQPALGHDDHPHPADPLSGRTGSVVTSLGGGHSEDMNVFYILSGRYTDGGGPDGIPPLTGEDTTLLFPKLREAEFYDDASEAVTVADSRDIEGHGTSIAGQDGAWASYDPVNLTNVDTLILRVASSSEGTIELRRDAPEGELLATAEVPDTGGATNYVDVPVSVTDPGESFTLYVVFPGEGERRLNFIEADGKGVSPTTKPNVAITSPGPDDDLEPGDIQVTADASDEENTITQVEFFVDGESIGVDTSAPYEATWTVTEERRYQLTAAATNDLGASTTSRIVQVEVGDLFGDWQTFSNANGVIDRPDTDTWIIESGGANMWQGTDEYTSAYLPAAAGEQWTATVRVDSQTNSADSAKAGLIVRNDVTQPGSSPGYTVMAMRAGNVFEWLHDSDGTGTLDTSFNAGSHGYPAWVRLVRDGDQYFAYWSLDGENFQSAGDPIELPGAAPAQDIGVAVTAHSTSETSVAEFRGFTLEDTAWYPEPDPGTDPPPVCATGVASDDFEGTELDTSRWTVVREAEGLPVSLADGELVLPVTNGDINESSGGPISYVGQPARDGAWQVETEVAIDHSREWQHAALMMHGTDDDYVKLAFTINSGGERFLEFQTESGGSRTWHANQTLPADFGSSIHLRLTSDGSQLTAAYSADGETWTDLAGAAQVIDGATIGLMAAGDTAAHEVDARFEHFTVTPDGSGDDGTREPSDEFDGDELDGCRWNAVVRYDASEVAMTDGALRITTQLGDINAGNNEDPRNFILQQLPQAEGDWTVETRLTPTMLHQWQLAGLLVYGDDDNYVKFDVVARNGASSATDLGAELVSEQGGDFGAGGNRQLDIAESTESGWYELRLTKSGNTYAAEISGDGINWTPLGDPVTNDADLDSFGLMAIGPQQQEAVTVAFDYFRYSQAQQDTTPPVVEVTTSPESPDGEGGWYVTKPVSVTATATDDSGSADIQTRTGDGDWTEYSAPVELFVDGTYDLEFRAVDAAGNVSEVVPVDVQLDATASALSASVHGSFAGPVTELDGSGVSGSAEMNVAADATAVTLSLSGLTPEVVYDSHLHSGTCADPGGHYRDNPNGPAEPPNELWPVTEGESGIVADADGNATASAEVPWAARAEARALMVHDETGAMVACTTLGLISDSAEVVVSATDATSGVDAVEYRVGGGEWSSYGDPIVVEGHGEYVIEVRAADVAGNTAESSVEFSIVTFEGTFELLDQLKDDGVLNQSQYARLTAFLGQTERMAGQDKPANAERALERFVSVAEQVDDDAARQTLLDAAFVLRHRL